MVHEKIKVDENLTRKIASLSRVKLTEKEVSVFTEQLSKVLDYIELLEEVDVSGSGKDPVEPMTQAVSHELPLREDRVQPFTKLPDGRPGIFESPAEVLMDGFQVPQIM